MFLFYAPWKRQETTFSFLVFPEGIEMSIR